MSGVATKPITFNGPMARAIQEKRKTQTRRILSPQNLRIWTGGLDFDGRYVRPDEAMMTAALNNARGFRFIEGLLSWQADCVPNQVGVLSQWLGKPTLRPGDLLWVRETWRPLQGYSNWDLRIRYAADDSEIHLQDCDVDVGDWRFPKAARKGMVTPLHMPRWVSRLTLRVTDVRFERVQDISEADAIAEGAPQYSSSIKLCRNRSYDPSVNGSYREGFSEMWEGIHGPGAWDRNDWVWRITFTPHLANVDTLLSERSGAGHGSERPENGGNT
ncbi:hypothetical protein [Fodinicurvata sp. EGI_FJ10296]|uniref:hypothetical protein n=1 Tax=Fodinicurvata sp. EGI_FJ10296 TaxID=3231908 RepID=UPI0034552351